MYKLFILAIITASLHACTPSAPETEVVTDSLTTDTTATIDTITVDSVVVDSVK